jgi:tetratricopeptide (TPR) repeat protein
MTLAIPNLPAGSVALNAVWGGPVSARVLGVLFSDGLVRVFRPASGAAACASGGHSTAPVQALAIFEDGQMVLGDRAGLSLHRVGGSSLESRARLDCGSVTSLASVPGLDEGYAGLADGRVIRFRTHESPPRLRLLAEQDLGHEGSPIVSLAFLDGGKRLGALRSSGRSVVLRRALGLPTTDLSGTLLLAESTDSGWRASVVSGLVLCLDPPDKRRPSIRLGLARPVSQLAFIDQGQQLLVAAKGQILWMDLSHADRIRPAAARVIHGGLGAPVIAVDAQRSEPPVLLPNREASIDMVALSDLRGMSRARPLDEVPELAFQPQRRFYRPRDPAPSRDPVVQAARDALDEGDGLRWLSQLRELEADSDRADLAEIKSLVACLEQDVGGISPTVLDKLGEAAELFRRTDRPDREADMRLWRGALLGPSLDGASTVIDPKRAEDGVRDLDVALSRYEKTQGSSRRQVVIARTFKAWGLLALGETRLANEVMESVLAERAKDDLLAQAVEIDFVTGAALAARARWIEAGEAFRRVAISIDSDGRPALQEQAELRWLYALSARDQWLEAAAVPSKSGVRIDSQRVVHQATARVRGAGPAPAQSKSKPIGPAEIHLLARLCAKDGRLIDAATDLERAREMELASHHEELAREATLERAEALERSGRISEAVLLYEQVVRSLRPSADRTQAGVSPIRAAIARAYRGLARGMLALDRASNALVAIEHGSLALWFEAVGEPTARSAGLGLPSETAQRQADLLAARRRHGPDSAQARVLERDLQNENRALRLGDPATAFDPSTLRLASDEAMLVYARVGPESVYGFVIRGERIVLAQRLPVDYKELRRGVWSWRKSLKDNGRGLVDEDGPIGLQGLVSLSPEPDASPADGPRPKGPTWDAYLYDALIGPFAQSLSDTRRLIIVPCDDLAALPIEGIGRSQRVFDRLALSYIPSLAFLQAQRAEDRTTITPKGKSLVISESPARAQALPPSLVLADGSARVLIGPDSSPERLYRSSFTSFGIVHLSGPAILNPLASSWGEPELRLAGEPSGSRQDGKLTTRDILRLSLRARVLVIDPSDRSNRDGVTGSALLSLARSGLAVGADHVLLALWDAPEASTPLWHFEFHRALGDGLTPPQALQRTRLTVRKDPRYRDPVHWAGYVLYGAP